MSRTYETLKQLPQKMFFMTGLTVIKFEPYNRKDYYVRGQFLLGFCCIVQRHILEA